jgi:hypothetical protein
VEPDTTEKKASSDEETKNPKAGASILSNFFRKKAPTSSSTATKERPTEPAAPAPATVKAPTSSLTATTEQPTEPAAPALATVDEYILVDSTSFKEGDVVEVAQRVRSLNSLTSLPNLLLGQRGRLVQIDAAGDALIHIFEHKEALQWVSKSDISKLRLLPIPPAVPKPGV